MQQFGIWDYVVLFLVLLTSSGIGIYYRFTGGKQRTVKEYLLADKNMPITPVAFSLMASFMSAITLLGVSSENYTFGIQFIVINFSYGLATPIAAYLYLPVFFNLQATSAYEYLEKRFGQTARLAASIAYSLQMILYMGIVLYAPALALEALTGISQVAAILVIGLVCTFYSTIGGMKAVLMTDVFQSLLMFAAVFCVIIYAIIDNGSVSEIWTIAEKGSRTDLLNFDPDPTVRHTWWTLIIGGGITYLSLYAVNQTQVQRYLTVKDLKTAQKALWLNWPILTLLSLSTSFSGLAIYSKYYKCDPVSAKQISSSDQLMPLYVVETMGQYPGLAGLFVAGIFSASLSTVSAAVNSLAAVTLEDYIKPLHLKMTNKPLPEDRLAVHTKIMAMIYGVICLAVAFLAQFMGGVLQASLTIFGVVGGPLLGLFTLGMFTITANQKGALTGLVLGLSLALWMAFGQPRPPLPKLPTSITGCNATLSRYGPIINPIHDHNEESTINAISSLNSTITYSAATDNKAQQDSETFFWLYRVSYLYNGVFGFLTTLIVGFCTSYLINVCTGAAEVHLDHNLFIPPLAERQRLKWAKILNTHELTRSEEDIKNLQKEITTLSESTAF